MLIKFTGTTVHLFNAFRRFALSNGKGALLKCNSFKITENSKRWDIGINSKTTIEMTSLSLDPYEYEKNPDKKITAQIDVDNETLENEDLFMSDIIFSDGNKYMPECRIGTLPKTSFIKESFDVVIGSGKDNNLFRPFNIEKFIVDGVNFSMVFDFPDVKIDEKKYVKNLIEDMKDFIETNISFLKSPGENDVVSSTIKGDMETVSIQKNDYTLWDIIESQLKKNKSEELYISFRPKVPHLLFNVVEVSAILKDDSPKICDFLITCLKSFVVELDEVISY